MGNKKRLSEWVERNWITGQSRVKKEKIGTLG